MGELAKQIQISNCIFLKWVNMLSIYVFDNFLFLIDEEHEIICDDFNGFYKY